ncbi:MAG TPA: bifunctional serine/threonine-protein kinase/formylglycine-generating enzyme family protein [Polyangiaceae bacterium]|nr:bifunctional serine/threonine-protein kinase/formylglycine-generating enzyme family protein [Polyangiaceae bacterium]
MHRAEDTPEAPPTEVSPTGQSRAVGAEDDTVILSTEKAAPVTGIRFSEGGERITALPVSSLEFEGLAARIDQKRYAILGRIGQGGMSTVYVARDESLRRQVALKLMRTDRDVHGDRFLEEMQVLGQLEHPNIVPLYTLEAAHDGTPYDTMRYLRGRSLHSVLNGLRNEESQVVAEYSLTRLMQIFLQVTQAVSFAHSKGVVHRDLKPANVMLGEHGEVQVVDWGIAKLAAASEVQTDSQRGLTVPGQIVGTPAYMAPEQWAGAPVEERADVYSLGVMLYELLTLRRPFDETNHLAFVQALLTQPPESPRTMAPKRNIPLELEEACLKALRKVPDERQRNAKELYRQVQAWLETETDKARRHELAESKAREGRELLSAYRSQRDRVEDLERQVRDLTGRFKSWQSVREKQALYYAEEDVQVARRQLVDIATDVVGVLTEAVGFERDNATARSLLADYYFDRLLEAERAAHKDEADFYARLVQRYHDGKYARQLSGEGTLTLDVFPRDPTLHLCPLKEVDLRLQASEIRPLGAQPITHLALPKGSYLLLVERAGYHSARYPIYISRNRDWRETVHLYREGQIQEGFCYVPGGPFIEGGDSEGWSVPRGEPHVPDFAIAKYPVTLREYLEFLNDLAERDLEQARKRAPRRAPDGGSYVGYVTGRGFVVPEELPDGLGELSAPVSGVSWYDAKAYAEWRSMRDGRAYRLPTAREWEKAARGVDGRFFPWGNRFDASLCNIRESMKVPRVTSVHTFETDESIYGVRGMAGNMRDWTESESKRGSDADSPSMRVVRGGAWYGGRVSARCADMFWFEPTHVYFFVGFRLAHSLTRA